MYKSDILVSKNPKDPNCNDFVVISNSSVWIEYPEQGIVVWILPNENGVVVELVPLDPGGSAEAELSLSSCGATTDEANRILDDWHELQEKENESV